ncbi:protein of unknown function [Methylorubrum extorquens]|uniref:Uncharacterized protein n=1 Tax=Methylorubrum extorquens TaxID=408 RepID=A0A2N9AN41_METEX|nr:protein of unknown function [Methylorubrum extorquens]
MNRARARYPSFDRETRAAAMCKPARHLCAKYPGVRLPSSRVQMLPRPLEAPPCTKIASLALRR